MKQIINKLLIGFLFVSLCGCMTNLYDPTDGIPGKGENPFKNVKIPSNFDWSMIHSTRLTVNAFDQYDGAYDYLVEVYDRNPSTANAGLLATGTTNARYPFIKKIVYPKGNSNNVYIQLTNPTGDVITRSVDLTSGEDYICDIDSASTAPSRETAIPNDQTVRKNPVFNYTFLIEDSFPQYGDYDYNDLVLYFTIETETSGNYVSQLTINTEIRAIGATKRAGVFVNLPTVSQESIKSASLSSQGNVSAETGKTPVFIISDNVHEMFLTGGGSMINTLDSLPYQKSKSRKLTITFEPGQVTDVSLADMDLFTTTMKKEGEKLRTEIHLRDFTYTEKGVHYRYYSNDNCVWALLIPGRIYYPSEHVFLGEAYPGLLKWVQGNSNQVQWYNNPDKEKIYQKEY